MSLSGRTSLQFFLVCCTLAVCAPCLYHEVAAETSTDRLRICTQNLFNYGEGPRAPDKRGGSQQRLHLVSRMTAARCDAVAVQEVFGSTRKEAQALLEGLAAELSRASGRVFTAHTGESFDERIRNGFLIAEDVFEIEEIESHYRYALPKLQPLGPTRHFTRGPFGALLKTKSATGGAPRHLLLMTMHFKSKAEAWKDPSGTAFEASRMEMAEALREIIRDELAKRGGDVVPVVLGDRNSDQGSASALILSGERELDDFSQEGGCRLNEDGEPLCPGKAPKEEYLVGLFGYGRERLRAQGFPGSYRFRGKWLLLDEIYVRRRDLPFFVDHEDGPAVGAVGKLYQGSDHMLLWVEIGLRRKGK